MVLQVVVFACVQSRKTQWKDFLCLETSCQRFGKGKRSWKIVRSVKLYLLSQWLLNEPLRPVFGVFVLYDYCCYFLNIKTNQIRSCTGSHLSTILSHLSSHHLATSADAREQWQGQLHRLSLQSQNWRRIYMQDLAFLCGSRHLQVHILECPQ